MSEGIFTIGYGSRSVEVFIQVLEDHKIQFLIDIRSSPYSRYSPSFSRESLKWALRERNIVYVFMGDQLGGRPADTTCYVDGKVDYTLVKERSFFIDGLKRLQNAWTQGRTVCLMCSEGKPGDCHRSKLVGQCLEERGIPVLHISADDSLETQQQVITNLTKGQIGLFGHAFTSRRAYRPNDTMDTKQRGKGE